MILSDGDIRRALRQGEVEIDPHPTTIQPAGVDVRLSNNFLVFDPSGHTHIDPREDNSDIMRAVYVAWDDYFVLHPNEFALGSTIEKVKVPPKYAIRLEGKSSLGRLGLVIHATAGFVDPGFWGNVTLELSNVSPLPIKLWPDMFIAQLSLVVLSSPARRPYGSPGLSSKYQGQQGPTASRGHYATPDGSVAQ